MIAWLYDPRLRPLALSPSAAWLWSPDGMRLLWANPAGAAMLGAPTSAALTAGSFDRTHAGAEVARVASTLRPDGVVRLERLRGLGAPFGGRLTGACSRLALADGTPAVLIAAVERGGADLAPAERAAKLLAACTEPLAVFDDDGTLLGATAPARRLIGDKTSLDALGAIIVDRIHEPPVWFATFDASEVERAAQAEGATQVETAATAPMPVRSPLLTPEPAPLPPPEAVVAADDPAHDTTGAEQPELLADLPPQPAPSTPIALEERRHPLRFVWQMDPEGRFTIDSPEFLALIGPRTAGLNGQPWPFIASVMNLDPEGLVARAVATRATWSGLAVAWRIDDSGERLGVELAGLPVFDRERAYRGYRGFGVCRDLALINAIVQARRSGVELAAPASPSAGLPPEPDAPGLTPVERYAFDELSRQLTSRINEADAQAQRAANSNMPALAHDMQASDAPCEAEPAIADRARTGEDALAEATAETLRVQLAELNAILDTATDGVIVLDRAARIVSVNASAQALFGYDAIELEGRSIAELLAPESIGTAVSYFERLQRQGFSALLNDGREVIGRERLGGLMPLFMTMDRLSDDGARYCAVFRDITRWKETEEELIAARRDAERASSAKSDFLARLSHELRTPLNAIIGFSEVMAEERFGPIGNERYRQYLKDIHTSGSHLIALINDLLDLSKIEAGKLELAFASVSLNDLTQQCVAIMQPQANRERVIIRSSLSPRLPPVLADARSVRQIVLNLLSNSIKFTLAGGQVIVSTAMSETGEVVLRVRDTGVGMTDKDLATALEPFRQIATTARGRSVGTGLGLPLTKALTEANHATFQIRSRPNEGTRVEITFPGARLLAAQ